MSNKYLCKTKAESEITVLENHKEALIIRTNFYGWGLSYRKSFSDMIIGELRKGKRIKLFEDVFYTPILIDTLVKIVHSMINLREYGITMLLVMIEFLNMILE